MPVFHPATHAGQQAVASLPPMTLQLGLSGARRPLPVQLLHGLNGDLVADVGDRNPVAAVVAMLDSRDPVLVVEPDAEPRVLAVLATDRLPWASRRLRRFQLEQQLRDRAPATRWRHVDHALFRANQLLRDLFDRLDAEVPERLEVEADARGVRLLVLRRYERDLREGGGKARFLFSGVFHSGWSSLMKSSADCTIARVLSFTLGAVAGRLSSHRFCSK